MAADATAVSTAVCSAAGGAAVSMVAGATAVSTAAISGSKLGSQRHSKYPGNSPTAAGSTNKITTCAQKPIFCALFYSWAHQSLPQTPESIPEDQLFISRVPLPLHPSTEMPILCSKRPKTVVPKAKSAQKPRFCARNARKWGFQTPKAHKNLDFVLECLSLKKVDSLNTSYYVYLSNDTKR